MPDKKELADYTFDELVDHCTWNVIQGIVKGEQLRSVIFTVVDLAARFHKQQAELESKE